MHRGVACACTRWRHCSGGGAPECALRHAPVSALQTFWQETIDAISLSGEQKDKILYMASMLVKSIKSCRSQREVLSRKLTGILPQTYGTAAAADVGAAVTAVDAMAELRKCASRCQPGAAARACF